MYIANRNMFLLLGLIWSSLYLWEIAVDCSGLMMLSVCQFCNSCLSCSLKRLEILEFFFIFWYEAHFWRLIIWGSKPVCEGKRSHKIWWSLLLRGEFENLIYLHEYLLVVHWPLIECSFNEPETSILDCCCAFRLYLLKFFDCWLEWPPCPVFFKTIIAFIFTISRKIDRVSMTQLLRYRWIPGVRDRQIEALKMSFFW